MIEDTIAAIATPLGEGGLAVVRLSGSRALKVADRCFKPAGRAAMTPLEAPTHTIHYGRIIHQGQPVDEVLLSVMRAPRTYTREDVVEISCHGGLLPAKLVLETLLENGARLARPGEFTQRAFLNGRLDLAQAEAVTDLIHARTELALRAAGEQLEGKLSRRINLLRDEMMTVLAHVEAHLDFPDEDIAPATLAQLLDRLDRGVVLMDELLRTANEGQILRRGVRAAIIGQPNAGKSSLLNQLLGHDRAIVSNLPGTTRDTIQETANIRGLPVVFIDTAGLRAAQNEIEAEGIRRSRAALTQAEFILQVFDASEPLTSADATYLAEFAVKKRILVRNKIDLQPKLGADDLQRAADRIAPPSPPVVDVCCITGAGIEALKDAIKNLIWSGEVKAGMLEVTINARHQETLGRARAAAQCAVDALRTGQPLDLAALDLRIAVSVIGEVVGKTTTEDLLDVIFSQFCIGK